MPRKDLIHLEGRVVEVLPNTVCRVELANGHRLLGYVIARDRARLPRLQPGRRVRLEMSPYDFSKGRILELIEQHEPEQK